MFRAGMPLKSLMQDDLIDFIGVRAEKTRQLYELGIKRFFEINGFRGEEHALFILRERGTDGALLKFVKVLHEEGRAPKTIHSYVTAVKAFLEYHNISYNNRQLRRLLPRKQVVRDVRPLSKSEVKLLLNMLRPVKRLACWTMFASGLRLDECLSLKVGDLDLASDPAKIYIKGSKTTNARRIVFIPSDLASELRSYAAGRRPDEYLFPTEKSPYVKMRPNRFRVAFYGALKKLGLLKRDSSGRGWIYHPHSLRRGFETALLNAGCPAITVSLLMGHDLGVTQSYYKPSEKELAETWRKFENALRLDIEEAIPSSRVSELEVKVKTMSEQIEALQEAVTFYEEVLNRLSRQNPKLLRKLGLRD
jgi:integrase